MQHYANINLQSTIEAYEKSSIDFMSNGINILNLLTNIEKTYLMSDIDAKKQILNTVLQNSYLKDGKLSYIYKKPFNIFAKGLNYLEILGRKDSNLRMPGPKPGALPLGDAPLSATFIILTAKI